MLAQRCSIWKAYLAFSTSHLVNRASSQYEIMKSVFEVCSFPRSASSKENQRMIPARRQHSSVSRLRYGIDMRRHIFAFATSEHVRDLKRRIELLF